MSDVGRDERSNADAGGSRARLLRAAAPLLVVAVALTLNLAGNARTGLWDRDEPRFAAAVREMRARGDWLLPTFNGAPRYHKPILVYWIMRAAYEVGGDNPFGARLTSACAGTLGCLTLWALGRRMFDARVGLTAALMLASAPIVVAESKLATTDALLMLWVVLAMWAYFELIRLRARGDDDAPGTPPNARAGFAWAALFWVATALAILTKGPSGPALCTAAIVATRLIGGPRPKLLAHHARWGLPLVAVLAAPWFVAVGRLSHGDFFRFAIGQQLVGRLTASVETHGGFPGYYVICTLLLFHPWASLLPIALRDAWQARRDRPELALLIGWAVGPLVVLECLPTKLVQYYLPAVPACALLAGWVTVEYARRAIGLRSVAWGRLAVGMQAAVGAGTALILIAATSVLPSALAPSLSALAVIAGVGTIAAAVRRRASPGLDATWIQVATWSLFMLVLGGRLIPDAEPYRTSRQVGVRLRTLADRHHAAPIVLEYKEPNVVYELGRPAPFVAHADQLEDFLRRPGGALAVAAFEDKDYRDLLADSRFVVSECGSVRGFSITKGRSQSVRIALVGRADALREAITGVVDNRKRFEPPRAVARRSLGPRGVREPRVSIGSPRGEDVLVK